jgi:hypothetical protein
MTMTMQSNDPKKIAYLPVMYCVNCTGGGSGDGDYDYGGGGDGGLKKSGSFLLFLVHLPCPTTP